VSARNTLRSIPMLGFIAFAVPMLATGASLSTSDYSVAKERAAMAYQAARTQCSQLAGNPRNVCLVEARAVERKAMADAEARYRDTDSARRDATIESAEAEFEVANARCGSRIGNEREVCVKEAKALEVRTKAEAIASEKIAAVRRDLRDEERNAEYEVAVEKCNALAGAPKDRCVADAKARYKK
jgi:hypothetical protein